MKKKSTMFDYPNYLEPVFDKLNKNDIKSVIVGGYIRDFLLNIVSKDIDIELYGVESFEKLEILLEEFGDVNSVGKSFGVCKLSLKNLEIDFTLPRIDNKISAGHKGFSVDVKPDLDFKTAANRRDFTINAIGYDVIEKEFLDPFNGKDDIKSKTLKAVNINTFVEDPLRVLRAVQFCSRFNFKMDKELFTVCKEMCEKNALGELAKERIFDEIKKILLKSQKPSTGFNILKELNALKYLSPLHTINENSFIEILSTLDNITKLKTSSNKTNIFLMLSAICYKFNKKQTEEFILNLTNEKSLLKNILSLVQIEFKENYSDSELLKLASKVNIEHFLILNKAVYNSYESKIFDTIKTRAKELNVFNKKAVPLLMGKDIVEFGIKPSKEYSRILNDAYEAQMDLKIKNKEEAKKWLENRLLS